MGTVFEAFDLEDSSRVAIKILHGKSETEALRFEQEAALLEELRHPTIVRFVAHGCTPHGEKYIVMEWLEGETLEARLARGPLQPGLVAMLAARVLPGLALAHGRGVVHRDMKPSNIFLADWQVAQAKILDFGVARRTQDPKRFTRKGATVGTPMYTSPEQARAEHDIDGRADIFSLGCVLFEALTREPAFHGESPAAVMTKICAGEPPQLAERCTNLDVELQVTIQEMLLQERDERPGDAAALGRVFAAIAERLSAHDAPGVRLPARRHGAREALSHGEQRVMTVLVLASISRSGERTPPSFDNRTSAEKIAQLPALPIGGDLQARVSALIEPFGGRLDRLLDRSLAISAPALGTVDEQAAQVARMALCLQSELPGLAQAIATGRGALLARLPAGEVVEVAATLLDGAAPGTVRLDETTTRLLGPRFRLDEVSDDRRLLGERLGWDDPRRVFDRVTPFVARERELGSLLALFEESATDQVARAAVVVGAPGIGKSRLCEEMLVPVLGAGHHPIVLRARGMIHAGGPGYTALHDLLLLAGISDGDLADPQLVMDKWTGFLRAQSAVQPVLVVVEDTHFADASSLQLLDATLRLLADCPIVVLAIGRSELADRLPNLFEQRAPLLMRVTPLSRRAAERLLRQLLPADLADHQKEMDWVLDRAQGTPYFIEELARHRLTRGRGVVPETVIGLFQGTLDALGADLKRVLRAASVFGDSFDKPGLLALLGEKQTQDLSDAVDLMVERGIFEYDATVLGRKMSPVPAANARPPQYRFVERLVREAVWMMLPAGDRSLARRLARTHLEGLGHTLPEVLRPGASKADQPGLVDAPSIGSSVAGG